MSQLLAVSVLMLCLTSALGLNCYTCNSTESEADCVKQQELQTCATGLNRCQTLFTTFNNGTIMAKTFEKKCSSDLMCSATDSVLCSDPDRMCSFSCCDTAGCNEMDGGEAPVPSQKPLQCYRCFSNKSWDDCDRVREEVSCSDDEEQSCIKLSFGVERDGQTTQGYFRSCFDTSLCEDDNDCKFESDDESITITKCEFSCCTEDLCNEAIALPMVSVIILLACVVEAVLL